MLSKHKISKTIIRYLEQIVVQDLAAHNFEVDIKTELARGKFGIWFKCIKNGTNFAVKVMSSTAHLFFKDFPLKKWNQISQRVECERYYFDKIGYHENVIELEECFYESHDLYLKDTFFQMQTIYMVMTLADCESLDVLVSKRGPILEHQAKYLASDLVSAISYLHSKGIAHLDVTPANCLLYKSAENSSPFEFVLKLSDFHLATTRMFIQYPVGSLNTMSPEMIRLLYLPQEDELSALNLVSTKKADWWSVGSTIFYMLHECYPLIFSSVSDLNAIFLDSNNQLVEPDLKVFYSSVHSKLRSFNDWLSSSCLSLLENLLEVDPQKRIAANSEMIQTWIHFEKDSNSAFKVPPNSFDNQYTYQQFNSLNQTQQLNQPEINNSNNDLSLNTEFQVESFFTELETKLDDYQSVNIGTAESDQNSIIILPTEDHPLINRAEAPSRRRKCCCCCTIL